MLERFILNLHGGMTERTFEGREHFVVPTVMMLEGVWTGSHGPVLYERDEIVKSNTTCNHKPVVIYHPEIKPGEPISACDPKVLDECKIGLLFNTSYADKQKAEVWLDKARFTKIDEALVKAGKPSVLTALRNNQPVEISTGYHMDLEPKDGEFNGKKYSHRASNLRLDHLAVLPDRKGAVSIIDGAGLLRNEDITQPMPPPVKIETPPPEVNHPKPPVVNDEKKKFFEQLQEHWIGLLSNEKKPVAVMQNDGSKKVVGNVLSHQEVARKLTANMIIESAAGYWPGYIQEVKDDAFLYCRDGKFYTRKYMVDLNHNAHPLGGAVEINNQPAPAVPGNNGAPQMTTLVDFINNAPPEMREPLRQMHAGHIQQRDHLIAKIVANKGNVFKPEQLQAMDFPTLQGLAAIAGAAATPAPAPTPWYGGAGGGFGGPVANQQDSAAKPEALGVPVINWKENLKEVQESRKAKSA